MGIAVRGTSMGLGEMKRDQRVIGKAERHQRRARRIPPEERGDSRHRIAARRIAADVSGIGKAQPRRQHQQQHHAAGNASQAKASR